MDIDSLSFRAFAHATEDEEKVKQAVTNISGSEELQCSKNHGYHGNPIVVIETKVTRSKEIKAVLNSLSEKDILELIETMELRVDEESFFYMRMDKQAAYMKESRLSRGEDVISVKGKIKSYPQSRDNALITIQNILQSILEKKTLKEE